MFSLASQKKLYQQKTTESSSSNRKMFDRHHQLHPATYLQKTIGNQATHRLLMDTTANNNFNNISAIPTTNINSFIQSKSRVNKPGDKYEREADYIAGKIMQDNSKVVYNSAMGHEKKKLAAKSDPTRIINKNQSEIPSIISEVVGSQGKPLDLVTRLTMEQRFGYDLSDIRIYTDTRAGASAEAINAHAYTIAPNIVFGTKQYSPQTSAGRWLLAHELTHIIQQSGRSTDRMSSQQNRSLEISHKSNNTIQRGEKWEQIKRVGPYDAWRAKKDADTAVRATRISGLPGPWNGPADAFRHALWNCLMAKSIGADQAKTVADTHEEFGKNHPNEKQMDDHNNAVGRLLGTKGKEKDCAELVMKALMDGRLLIIPNYNDVSKTRGKIPPQKPVSSKSVVIPKIKTDKLKYDKTGYAGNNYN